MENLFSAIVLHNYVEQPEPVYCFSMSLERNFVCRPILNGTNGLAQLEIVNMICAQVGTDVEAVLLVRNKRRPIALKRPPVLKLPIR